MTVRRLAALDMYGTRGNPQRRRIILLEFVLGVVATVAIGVWLVAIASTTAALIFGLWVIGAGVNYLPLAVYATRLSQPGALSKELAGVDTGRMVRRYSVWQLWMLIPLALVVIALRAPSPQRSP